MSSSDDEDDVPLAIPKLSETVPVHNDAASAARSTPVPVTLVTGGALTLTSPASCDGLTWSAAGGAQQRVLRQPCLHADLRAAHKRHLAPAGFLGAGKSTLIRHILTADHGFRIAVILNEFADDTSIERAIVSDEQVSSQVLGFETHARMLCRRRLQVSSVCQPSLGLADDVFKGALARPQRSRS